MSQAAFQYEQTKLPCLLVSMHTSQQLSDQVSHSEYLGLIFGLGRWNARESFDDAEKRDSTLSRLASRLILLVTALR